MSEGSANASGRPAGVAIVLGSGLGGFAARCDRVLKEVTFAEAGIPESGVAGHEGRFILGELAGKVVWLMKGRVHLYEGHSGTAVAAGVRWLAAQGVQTLVLTNAAGCLNPDFAPGEWMMITDQINLTGTSPLVGGAQFHDMSEVYSARLLDSFGSMAMGVGLRLREGIYAGVVGPQYETPAEVRLLRTFGADAVGMSTVLEAIQARALGLEVAGFSCLTNMAAGLSPDVPNHREVLDAGRRAADQLADLLAGWVHYLNG